MNISYYLPPKKLTNEDLAAEFAHPDWTPDKIYRKVGVRTRYVSEGELSSDLAVKAAEKLFAEHCVARDEIDFLLLCTQTPDYIVPSTVCIVQDKLGLPTSIGSLCFDFGCSGWVYGLFTAKALLASGAAKNILFITSEYQTHSYHPLDRAGRVLFSDCAAATFLTRDDVTHIGDFALGTDGSGAQDLIIPAGGGAMPCSPETRRETTDESGNVRTLENVHMNGVEIFTFSRKIVPTLVDETLRKNGLALDDIDYFVLHQANSLILTMLMTQLKIPRERFCIDIEDVGNTASCTIPLALRRALDREPDRLTAGAKILVAGFGVGYSWAATVITL